MKSTKKWKVLVKDTLQESQFSKELLLKILLENRGLTTKKEQDAFLHPDIKTVTTRSVGINKKQEEKTLARIKKAHSAKEQIIVFGDYDVDGIAGTAILWETLHTAGAKVMPYIPSRVDEGYGLSVKGIENILLQFPDTKLIITVDNGIVANSSVDFANEKGIDIIITDHHLPSTSLPKAHAIFHTTALCGTGVAWILSRLIHSYDNDHIGLVAMATVTDLVPLQGANRIVLAEGLKVLQTTKRPGIIAMCEESHIEQRKIGVYEIGHILGPRVNAMGRISHAMDSLRLLCTKDRLKAKVFAEKLSITNKDRQELTRALSEHAIARVKNQESRIKNLLFVSHTTYDEGVIGLVAGKLVETYYRPSIVVSLGKKISKASARSVAGFNIIAFIRKAEHLLINAGGHPMAAGFSVYTEKVAQLEKFLLEHVKEELSEELLTKTLIIDCELPLACISQKVYDDMQLLQPFGMGNPEPTFVASAKVLSVKQVGKEKNHLSLTVQSVILGDTVASESEENKSQTNLQAEPSGRCQDDNEKNNKIFSAIAFGMGEKIHEIQVGDTIAIAYSLDENVWRDKKSLQLKIRDIQ